MSTHTQPIRAVVASSRLDQMRQLAQVLELDGDITLVGQPVTAVDTIASVAMTRPDIVVLDLSLIDDGHAAIAQIMDRTPTPILVLAGRRADHNSPPVVDALVAGALDAIPLPSQWTPDRGSELREMVRRLSTVQVIRHMRGRVSAPPSNDQVARSGWQPVVAMAASTGGPSALACVLSGLAGLPVPVLVVQHLHPEFTSGLLGLMSRTSALPVQMAERGQIARPGQVYLAPSGLHLRLGPRLRLELDPTPVTTHRPSADVLFESVAAHAGRAAVGLLLTGMGDDGAHGMLAIHAGGGQTLAQDKQSCAVFGMPHAAQQLGAVTDLRPLDQLAAGVRQAVRSVTDAPASPHARLDGGRR